MNTFFLSCAYLFRVWATNLSPSYCADRSLIKNWFALLLDIVHFIICFLTSSFDFLNPCIVILNISIKIRKKIHRVCMNRATLFQLSSSSLLLLVTYNLHSFGVLTETVTLLWCYCKIKIANKVDTFMSALFGLRAHFSCLWVMCTEFAEHLLTHEL